MFCLCKLSLVFFVVISIMLQSSQLGMAFLTACFRRCRRSNFASHNHKTLTAEGSLYLHRSFASSNRLSDTAKNFGNEGWITVDMTKNPSERKQIEMQERILSAKKSIDTSTEQSFQLDPEDGEKFDRILGIYKGRREPIDRDLIIAPAKTSASRRKVTSSIVKDKRNTAGAKKKLAMQLDSVRENSDLPSKAIRGFLELNPFLCSGCGSSFQSKHPDAPGFLPSEKFHEHRESAESIRKQQEAIRILKMADIEFNSPAAEKMLRLSGHSDAVIERVKNIETKRDTQDEISQFGLDQPLCICQRCFRLQQYGQVEHSLRPGWSNNQLLTPERFESLLSTIKDTETVVLCIVDIFDLQGSVVRNLKAIAGDNPVVIAVNKIDLLPKDISHIRVTNWVHSEIKRICGFASPKFGETLQGVRKKMEESGILRISNVHLISCQSDYGIKDVVTKIVSLASDFGNKVHVLGAANVGKSSFINRLLSPSIPSSGNSRSYQQKKKKIPLVTVSNLPGTTLDFLKIKLPNGVTIVDTPGLINKGHLTSKLTTDELKKVLPSKPVTPITLRLEEGKCVLLGGFAKLDFLEGRPFYFTFFVSNDIKLHQTESSKADNFIKIHIGKLIFPPEKYSRIEEVGPFESTDIEVQGDGWKQSNEDIVIPGVGWIAITGAGSAKIRITAPSGTDVSTRPSLLPFEAQYSTAKFTGSKILKKSSK